MSTAKSRFFELFANVADSSGYGTVKSTVKNLADAFDFSTANGARFQKLLVDLSGKFLAIIFGPLQRLTAGDNLVKFLNSVQTGIVTLQIYWSMAWPTIAAVFQASWAIIQTVFKWLIASIPTLSAFARDFGAGFRDSFTFMNTAFQAAKPIVDWLAQLIGHLVGGKAGARSLGSEVAYVLGIMAPFILLLQGGLFVFGGVIRAFGILNVFTGGLAGKVLQLAGWLLRLGFQSIVPLLGFIGRFVTIVFTLGGGMVRLAAQGLWMGVRLAAAWLLGLGPIGWVIAAVIAIGAALVLAYNKVAWFRNGVNAAWDWIKAEGETLLKWFEALPGKLESFFSDLPNRLKGIGQGIYEALVPAPIRMAIDKLIGGAQAISGAVQTAFTGGVQASIPVSGGGDSSGQGANAAASGYGMSVLDQQIGMAADVLRKKLTSAGGDYWGTTGGIRRYNGLGKNADGSWMNPNYVADVSAAYRDQPWLAAMKKAAGPRRDELMYINAQTDVIAKQKGIDPRTLKGLMWWESEGWQANLPGDQGRGGGLGQVLGYHVPPRGTGGPVPTAPMPLPAPTSKGTSATAPTVHIAVHIPPGVKASDAVMIQAAARQGAHEGTLTAMEIAAMQGGHSR
jgi:hypothetical protein